MNHVDRYRALKKPVAPFIRRHWRHPVFAGGARLAQRYLNIYGNNSHDLFTNGEAEYLARIPAGRIGMAVDVGCYKAEWTDLLHRTQPQAVVHAFEASPVTAGPLVERFADHPLVTLNQAALGPEPGSATLWIVDDSPSLNSLVHDPTLASRPVEVPVLRGDRYLREHGIDHVDALKIDTEGFDLRVLQGFGDLLAEGAIDLIQFEYNGWNRVSRTLLADFYDLLGTHGYRLGKVHPDGIDFTDYRPTDENWIGPACVAVHRDHPDLIELVGPQR